MAYVPIPKDLDKIKTKVAFNLTKRQLIGFSVAGLIGIPTYIFMKKYLPNDVSIIVMLIVTLPIFFITLYEKDTLTFEKYFKFFYLHKFYQPTKRIRKEAYLEAKKKANQRLKSKGKTIKKDRKEVRRLKTKKEPTNSLLSVLLKKEKKRFTVEDTIPYIRMLPEGICQLDRKKLFKDNFISRYKLPVGIGRR